MANIPSITEVYEQRRLRNQQIRRDKLEAIYEACPALQDTEIALKQLEVSRATAMLTHSRDWNPESYEAQKKELQESKQKRLKELHLQEDYAKEIFTCERCKDTGVLMGEHCPCYRQLKADLLFSHSPIRLRLEKENFSTFDFNCFSSEIKPGYTCSPRDNMRTIYDSAKAFIADFPNGMNLLFQGSTGTGKSFMSNCIACELIKEGYFVTYLSATSFFEVLADHAFHQGDAATTQERYRYIFDCDLLIVDDLGTEVNNQFTSSALFEYLNAHALRQTSTIISTNLSMKQLEDNYSKRVSSRILENFHIFPMFGDNIRTK